MSALTLEWRGKVRIAIIILLLQETVCRTHNAESTQSSHWQRNSCAISKDSWSMTPFMFPTIGKPLPAGNAETVMNPEAKAVQVFSSSHSGPKRQPRTSSWQKINTTSMWTKHCFLLFRNRALYPWVEYYKVQTILTGDISLGMLRKKLQQSGLYCKLQQLMIMIYIFMLNATVRVDLSVNSWG